MSPPVRFDAYCGPAPQPEEILLRWNWDAPVIAGLLALAALYWRLAPGFRWLQAGVLIALVVVFVSPLCAASAALFSARALHHVLLVALAAPLFALTWNRPPRLSLTLTAALHIASMWFWHAPTPYAWALGAPEAYWVMELSLFITASAFWRAALDRSVSALSSAIAMLAISMLMGALGALIAFAPNPFYAPHSTTTLAWGLSPLEDQQLAGLVLWIVGAAPYLLCAVFNGVRLVQPRGSGAPWLG